MQITKHAQIRLRERGIGEWQMDLALEHGEWNTRGDRLFLGERSLRKLIADRRQLLRKIETAEQRSHRVRTMHLNNGDH